MLIGDLGEGEEAAAGTARQNDTFHEQILMNKPERKMT
jgi:hypothetical protein